MAAALSHIPTMIQEQNVIPGVTNKILSHVVDRVALGYKEAKARFPVQDKCVYTGNPTRPAIREAKRDESRKKLGIRPDDFMVLIAGGSRGARNINNAMLGVHRHFKDTPGLCLYHVTGTRDYGNVLKELGEVDERGYYGSSSRIVDYQHDMPSAMAAADLVIYRAGAVGLAEVAVRGLPSILIPYPYAAEDHQTYNARVFVAAGAAKMIEDKYLTAQELIQDIEELHNHKDVLAGMAEAAEKLGKASAGANIAHMALELAGKKGER